MPNGQMLNDKFSAIVLPKVYVQRPEILSRFHKEADKRIIYVCAPAGYGKTVSTQLWLDNSGRESVWINLDSYDNSPSIFYKQACAGIMSLQPDNQAMARVYRSPSFAASPVEHSIRFLAEFIPDQKSYALVFDDAHHITDKELIKSCLMVQKRLPLCFQLLVLTRNNISEEYLSIVGRNKYALITADELAFSLEETKKFFVSHGRSITEEQAAKAHSITGGWAIGIKALALSGQIDPGQEGSLILDGYIKNQIWDKWDNSLKKFMLQTSIVDKMPVELCQRLTGRADSKKVLEALCNANSFISRRAEGEYAYHHLFLDFLRREAAEYGLETNGLYLEATQYYMEQEEYFIARWCASKSGDTEALMRVIYELSRYGSASLDKFVSFAKLYEDLPEYICDQAPFLYATMMWENYLRGNAAKMEYYMDKLYQFMPKIAEQFPSYLETVMMQISLEHRIPLSMLLERVETLPVLTYMNESQRGATLTHELPFLHRSNRDYYELTDSELLEKIKKYLGGLLREHMDIIFSSIQSGLLLEQQRPQEALEYALQAQNLIDEHTSAELYFSVYAHLGAAYYALKNRKYQEAFAQAEQFIENSGAHHLRPNFLAVKTKILLLDGDKNAARKWLDNYFVTDSEQLELYKIYQYFTTAKSYVVLGQMEQAISYITKLRQLSRDFVRPLDIAEAGVLQAVVEWATGKKQEAQLTLETVLLELQTYGFIRVVAIEGAAVLPILKRLNAKVRKENYQGPLEAHFLHKITLAAYTQAKQHQGITVHINAKPIKLSKQQKLILTLLSRGYKYTEIMQETGLTIHTVKSHASAAYRKLGVGNSLDATLKARELELIE